MPWFYCDICGDSVKKPKVAAHCNQCRHATFTCIDCSRPFNQTTVHGHTSCVTEHEKYAQGATKPGGFASGGFYGDGTTEQQNGVGSSGGVEGLEFLSTRAPWKCSICNVNCTSSETLMGHAAGAKHKRRAKAAIAARDGGNENKEEEKVEATATATANGQNGISTSDGNDTPSTKENKKKKKKKNKEIKWKKLAATELKKSGGDMKSKKLIKLIVREAAAVDGNVDADSDKIIQKLEKSKKFNVEGRTISLVKA